MNVLVKSKRYFTTLPMVGISVSIATLIYFMIIKMPSTFYSILYALVPVFFTFVVSVIAKFYFKGKNLKYEETLPIKTITIVMLLSLAMFIIIYFVFFSK